jgi:hypothetical protein
MLPPIQFVGAAGTPRLRYGLFGFCGDANVAIESAERRIMLIEAGSVVQAEQAIHLLPLPM